MRLKSTCKPFQLSTLSSLIQVSQGQQNNSVKISRNCIFTLLTLNCVYFGYGSRLPLRKMTCTQHLLTNVNCSLIIIIVINLFAASFFFCAISELNCCARDRREWNLQHCEVNRSTSHSQSEGYIRTSTHRR